MSQRARVRGLLAFVSSTREHERRDSVNQDLNAAMNIRRPAALKTRPEALMPFNSVGHPLTLEYCTEMLKPMAGGRSETAWRRLSGGIYG